MKSRSVYLLFALFIFLLSFSASPYEDEVVKIDTGSTYQTMRGFGTCLIDWKENFKGIYLRKEFQKIYAEDLGASLVRVQVSPLNLQKEILDWRDISWQDLTMETGPSYEELQFIKGIQEINPDIRVIAAPWSPPWWMKTNNNIDNGGSLRKDRYMHFAKYLAEWCIYMRDVNKTPVYALSLQNEAYFKQFFNSCKYTPYELRDLITITGTLFEKMNIDTLLMIPEDMSDQTNRVISYVEAVMNDQQAAEHLDIIATHGYYDGVLSSATAEGYERLVNTLSVYGREFWMTETSGEHPVWNDGFNIQGEPTTTGPGAFNGLALKIHNALTFGNVSVWTYWQISDPGHTNPHEEKYALMIGMEKTKKYYVSKQYYKYIRPGAIRVDAESGGKEILASAFFHEDEKTVTVVLLNVSERIQQVRVDAVFEGAYAVAAYFTDEHNNWAEAAVTTDDTAVQVELPARSIATIYLQKEGD